MADDPLSVFLVDEETKKEKQTKARARSSVMEEAEAFLGGGAKRSVTTNGGTSREVKLAGGVDAHSDKSIVVTEQRQGVSNGNSSTHVASTVVPSSATSVSSGSYSSVPTVLGVEKKAGGSTLSSSNSSGGEASQRGRAGDGGSTSSSFATADEGDEYYLGSEISLLTGERRLICLRDCYVNVGAGMISCTLFMTDYRIVLIPALADLATIAIKNPSVHAWLQISLTCVDRIEKGRKARDAKDSSYVCINIRLMCKDCREYQIAVREREAEIDKALNVMSAYAFPNSLKHIFAFSHALPKGPPEYGKVEAYDSMKEYSRQRILEVKNPALREIMANAADYNDHPWRVSQVNCEYKLCNTYPRLLIVPAACTDPDLYRVAAFRSGERLPTLSWGDVDTGATLWRASQPKAGVSGSSEFDEKFLDFLAKSCVGMPAAPPPTRRGPGYPLLFIVDCRPRASAIANRAAGAGYETQTNYPNTRLEFYNIGNIHVMRDSLKSICGLVLSPVAAGSGDMNFSKAVEDTAWLSHVRHILKASYDSADYIRKGVPVLVHCSHGWDRTAQVCSLAQLLLDPYYRTMQGFKVLVEKEWCSFGHQFGMRCAHGQDRAARKEDEVSPIFLQFLDATWQLVRQQPHYFEFNAKYLLVLADHLHSGRFGTFLFSSDRERDALGAANLPDVWTYLHYTRDVFLNPLYLDPSHQQSESISPMLFPPLVQVLRNVTLWTDYFFRYNFSSGNAAPFPLPPLADTLHLSGLSLPQQSLQMQMAGDGDSSDFTVPALVTQDSHWESLYKRELSEKQELQRELDSLKHRISGGVAAVGAGGGHTHTHVREGDTEEIRVSTATGAGGSEEEGGGDAPAASHDAGSIEDIERYLTSIGGSPDSDIFSSP